MWLSCLVTGMAALPKWFEEEYDNHGESFFAVAQLLYENHGQQFTADDIAAEVDVGKRRVEQLLEILEDDGWADANTGPKAYVWNTEKHNPAETAATEAVFGLYRDLWQVFKTHAQTSTGPFAIFGFALFVAASVLLVIGGSFSTGLAESAISPWYYVGIGLGLAFTGLVVTGFAPYQALVNRLLNRVIGPPDDDEEGE